MTRQDVAAYLLDRAAQYVDGSGCSVALTDAAHAIACGEVEVELSRGELSDTELRQRVKLMAATGPAPSVNPTMGLDEFDDEEDEEGT